MFTLKADVSWERLTMASAQFLKMRGIEDKHMLQDVLQTEFLGVSPLLPARDRKWQAGRGIRRIRSIRGISPVSEFSVPQPRLTFEPV
jgi:hypothetical protein